MSSNGRVKTSTGVVSFGYLNQSGYYSATIKGQHFFVHRLVAAAFIGPPQALEQWQVHHIDGNPSNNHMQNLEYVTQSDNIRHSWSTRNRKSSAANEDTAILWRVAGDSRWTECPAQFEAAKALGVNQSCISRCCRGLVAACQGACDRYEFKFAGNGEAKVVAGETWQVATYPGRDDAFGDLLVSSHGRIMSKV